MVWFIYHTIFNINIFQGAGYGLSTTTKIVTNHFGKLTNFEKNIRKDLNLVRIGDVLFFHRQSLFDNEPKMNNKYPGHCGIYLGNNNFIHASKPKGKVIISNFDNNLYWYNVLVGSKDFFSNKILLEKVRK